MNDDFIEQLNSRISKSVNEGTLHDDYPSLYKMVRKKGFSSYLLQLLITHNIKLQKTEARRCDDICSFVYLGNKPVDTDVESCSKVKIEPRVIYKKWGWPTWFLLAVVVILSLILSLILYKVFLDPSISYKIFKTFK